MNSAATAVERGASPEVSADARPADELERQVLSLLEHAVDAHKRNLMVYQSLRNLDEVIGTEYGDRVLYELIQNAHDAHPSGGDGRIAIELVIHSEKEGVLCVANGGNGFRWKDVEAIRNLATSAKEVGEGIGNKGLGFRSIEALTDDVRIYSRNGRSQSNEFDGYCFRFADTRETEQLLRSFGFDEATSAAVAPTVPRYLVPRPLEDHPDEIAAYARRGYATVIAAPLRTSEAVALASRQVNALAHLELPLLLFLDRIAEIRINIERPDHRPYRRRLSRRQTPISVVPSLPGTRMHEVDVGGGRRFLVVRREVDKERVLEAVERSIPMAPQIKRWLNWKGTPVVSAAVGLSAAAVTTGRLYNFLPMGEEAASPFLGYLDAPFFSDIDRRDADLDLPLNETLMEAAAETCGAAALSIVQHDMAIPAQAVFDLFAWTGEQAGKLSTALREAGSSLSEAAVIPAIADNGRKAWSCLSEIRIWPEGTFSIFKDREVAKHVGAQLVSKDLDSNRIERLKAVARRIFYRPLTPSGAQLAKWSEVFARSLLERKVAPRTWSRFYDDLPRVFDAANTPLEALDEKAILCDRSGMLRSAGGHSDKKRTGLFVRNDVPKGKRKKAGIPLPPATLARRYRFLDDRIVLRPETLDAFLEANLVREYDPVEALAGLKSALGRKVNDQRRQEALVWAFHVWRAASGARLEEELQNERAEARRMPVLEQAFEDFMAANPKRASRTDKLYREEFARHFADWRERPLDAISRRDVEARFNRLTEDNGWSPANRVISLLRSIYRRPCVDLDDLRNPVDLWLAGGGKYHRNRRRKISTPSEVLPCWKTGIEAAVNTPRAQDAFWFGLYTGTRLNEVLPLRWRCVDLAELVFRVEETKMGAPLELPITRQLATILKRRLADGGAAPGTSGDWVFPSILPGALGHIADLSHLYGRIGEAGGTRFWYHGLRNVFITVAERDLLLPHALTRRLVNHAPPNDVTEGYAADWTIEQLRKPAQRIADRIEALMDRTPPT